MNKGLTPDDAMAVLGHLVAQAGGAGAGIAGVLEVWVGGPEGGRWIVDFNKGLVTRGQATTSAPDLRVLATPAAIGGLWRGAEAVAFYQATGQLKVEGDPRSLQALAKALTRRSNPLATRFLRGGSRRAGKKET